MAEADRTYTMGLAAPRQAAELTQVKLARRMEQPHDLLLSTSTPMSGKPTRGRAAHGLSGSREAPGELLVLTVSGSGRRVRGFGSAAVFGVEAQGLFELVFEDDDAAGGLDGGPVVDKFPGAGRDAQLVAGVAAVAALGAERGDQAGLADSAQEALGGAEHLGGPAHRVGGVVVVVEPAVGLACRHRTSR
jgi:hypothetical protein